MTQVAAPADSEALAKEIPPSRKGAIFLSSLQRPLLVFLGGALLVGVWEWTAEARDLSFWISQPTSVLATAYDWAVSGSIWPHLISTIEAVAYGFALGSVVAVAAALVLHELPWVQRVLNPFVVAMYSLPKVALAPIFIVWFGIGLAPKVVLAAVITFFIVFYQTADALRDVSQDLLNAVRIMGASRGETYRKIVAPASRYWLVHALRLAFPKAFTGAIIGEIIASNQGVGYLARLYSGMFDATGTLTALFYMLLITLPMHYLLGLGKGATDADAAGA